MLTYQFDCQQKYSSDWKMLSGTFKKLLQIFTKPFHYHEPVFVAFEFTITSSNKLWNSKKLESMKSHPLLN